MSRQPRARCRRPLPVRVRRGRVRRRVGRAAARLPRLRSITRRGDDRTVRDRAESETMPVLAGPTPSRFWAASRDGSISSSGGGPSPSASWPSPRSRTARDGFELTPMGAMYLGGSLAMYERSAALRSTYQGVEAGDVLRQLGARPHHRGARGGRARRVLPRTDREQNSRHPPGRRRPAHHRGPRLARGPMGRAAPRPVPRRRDRRAAATDTGRTPPLEALRILDGFPLSADGPDRHHLLIEATKLALQDRNDYVSDPTRCG